MYEIHETITRIYQINAESLDEAYNLAMNLGETNFEDQSQGITYILETSTQKELIL
jgi:hypothetical protein